MPKKKKLQLEKLKINSFVTGIEEERKLDEFKGGGTWSECETQNTDCTCQTICSCPYYNSCVICPTEPDVCFTEGACPHTNGCA